jgi:hypothetical protein
VVPEKQGIAARATLEREGAVSSLSYCRRAQTLSPRNGCPLASRRRRGASPSPSCSSGRGRTKPIRHPRWAAIAAPRAEALSSRGKPLATLSARRLANSGAGRRSHASNWAAPAAAHAPRAASREPRAAKPCMPELRGQGTSLETKVRGPIAPTHDLNRTQRILVEPPRWVAPSMSSLCYRRASAEALSPSRGVLIATLRMRRARHAPPARRCTKDGRSGRADTEVFNSREASSPRRSPATLLANFRHRPPPHGPISQPRRRTRPSSSKSAC